MCCITAYCEARFHSCHQTVCYCNTADGEVKIKDLHSYVECVRAFYEQFKNDQVSVGYETSGYALRFEAEALSSPSFSLFDFRNLLCLRLGNQIQIN